MLSDTFAPYRRETPNRKRGCYTCVSFLGRFYRGSLICSRDRSLQVIGSPLRGGAFWKRATGADDA